MDAGSGMPGWFFGSPRKMFAAKMAGETYIRTEDCEIGKEGEKRDKVTASLLKKLVLL